MKHLEIAKILYNYIPKYPTKNTLKKQLPIFTLLNLMTGHRYGELAKLTTKNLDLENMRIKAFRNQTKTKITTCYSYPEECNKYFEKFKNIKDERKLFPDIIPTSYGTIFKIILREALRKRNTLL